MNDLFNLPADVADLKRLCIKAIDSEPTVALDSLDKGQSATYVLIRSLAVFANVIVYVSILILAELRKINGKQQ